MSGGIRCRGTFVLALVWLCLGLVAPAAGAAEFKYTLDPELSLTGDCSTTPGVDEVKDPDCEPTYPPPPNGPSGRFDRPYSVVVDDWGNQYVLSRSGDGTKGRIDVFDSEGRFITELKDPYRPESAAVDGEGNLYVFESLPTGPGAPLRTIVRYSPTTYNPAVGEIAYDPDDRTVVAAYPDVNFVFNGLTIDRADPEDTSDDRLYVAEGERIRIYSSAVDGNTLVDTITPAGLGYATYAVVDAERRLLYTIRCNPSDAVKCVVWVLEADAPYAFIKEVNGSNTPQNKFFSEQGRLSIAVDETNGHLFIGDLLARDDVYEFDENHEFVSTFQVSGAPVEAGQADVAENPEDEDTKNFRHLYVPLVASSGSAYAFAPPEITDPEIEDAAAVNVGQREAELEARIKPNQLATEYAIEYVSEVQFKVDGFASATVAKSGILPAVKPPQRVSAVVTGLEPGAAYRFRVFAENELGEDEEEGAFITFEESELPGCPNEVLRVGPSAGLPDCRAYELVTPPGARGPSGASFDGERFGMVQSAPDGNTMSFELNGGALPGTEASGYFFGDPYLAIRGDSGWATELAGPTGQQASKPQPGSFSPDQGYSFWTATGDGSAIVGGKPTNYVRYPDGHSELIGRGSIDTDPYALGRLITENGTHIVFETNEFPQAPQKLEPDAPEEGIEAVYDRTRDPISGVEETHVVSLLPGEVTPTQDASFAGASADGEGIAFEIGTTLYFRVHNEETFAIGAGAVFAGIADGGERIFYVEGGDLKAFDADTEAETDFTGGAIAAATPVNVAPLGTRAYFVSETAAGGANPNGDSAVGGEQNLYLSEEGTVTFVATVTEEDMEGRENGVGGVGHGLGLWTESLEKRQPGIGPSRLTPDGTVFAFQSQANLAGYQPGEDPQVYRYDSVTDRLHCVSCPPTKTAATGGAKLQSLRHLEPAPFDRFGFVPALRADGERLFFESDEALVPGDTDGLLDVYEWEGDGVGSCDKVGGCLYLISSGQSAKADFLFGHSASGDDVFIFTTDALVPGNPETLAIYDARVNGGFAVEEKPICVAEACRPDLTPPPVLPQVGVGNQAGNFPPQTTKKCPKGKRKVKRKGKVVCIKKKKQGKGKANRASAGRGAGR